MASRGLIPLWFIACHLLLSSSSYRAIWKSHKGFAHKIFTPKASSWGGNCKEAQGRFNDGHLNSLADSGDGSWPSALEDGLLKPHVQAGMVSFMLQAGGLTSLLHSLKSVCSPGQCRGRKPALPRAAKPAPALTLGWGHRRFCGRRDGSCFGSVKLGDNYCADQGESWQLWNCWDQHKTEIPSGSKLAAHHKHSLLLWLVLLWFLLPRIFDSDCFNHLLFIVMATGMGEIPALSSFWI